MNYYICTYSDYGSLPATLFCDNTPTGSERKSIDETKFVVRCDHHTPGNGCLDWMLGSESALTHSEVLSVLQGPEWAEPEE